MLGENTRNLCAKMRCLSASKASQYAVSGPSMAARSSAGGRFGHHLRRQIGGRRIGAHIDVPAVHAGAAERVDRYLALAVESQHHNAPAGLILAQKAAARAPMTITALCLGIAFMWMPAR